MPPRRYELSDFEWSIIAPLRPNKPRGVARADDRKVLNGIYLAAADRVALGGHSRAVWPLDDLLQPFRPLAGAGHVGSSFRGSIGGVPRRSADDRQHLDLVHQHGANAKKGFREKRGDRLSGRRWDRMHRALAGGLTTKIRALVDTNGLPITLKITEGQAHDASARGTCSPASPKALSCLPTAPTTATNSADQPPAEARGRTSSRCPTG